MLEYLFNKVAGLLKRDSNTEFFGEIFKNAYFEDHLQTTGS